MVFIPPPPPPKCAGQYGALCGAPPPPPAPPAAPPPPLPPLGDFGGAPPPPSGGALTDFGAPGPEQNEIPLPPVFTSPGATPTSSSSSAFAPVVLPLDFQASRDDAPTVGRLAEPLSPAVVAAVVGAVVLVALVATIRKKRR